MAAVIVPTDVPHSLKDALPSVYWSEDEFAIGLAESFDRVLSPIHLVLDCLDLFFDPSSTPDDFVPWLAYWVGVAVNERWSDEQRREYIRSAVELYRWRGTPRGIQQAVEIYTGVRPDVLDNGATSWSQQPNGAIPGNPVGELVVRLPAEKLDGIDLETVDRLVASTKPAHVPHRVEVANAG